MRDGTDNESDNDSPLSLRCTCCGCSTPGGSSPGGSRMLAPTANHDATRDAWLAAAMASAAQPAEEHGGGHDEVLVERAQFVREQLALLQRYAFMCTLLAQHQHWLNEPPTSASEWLVPLRFPVKLTPKTRSYLLEGLATSLAAFVNELHHASVHTSVEFLEPGPDRLGVGTAEFANAMAADLWVQTTQLVDRETATTQARTRLLQLLDDFAARAVADERSRLRALHGHCACLRDACNDFGRRLLVGRRRTEPDARRKTARHWLTSAGRGGACLAVRVLVRRRRSAAVFAQLDVGRMVAAFGSLDTLDDRAAEELYDCMERTHNKLATAMTWEVRRIDWLTETPATHPCWSGVVIAADACDHNADERLLMAPSHMAGFATGRLRVVVDPALQQTAYTCGLTRVRVARLLAQLLRGGHLPLNRIDRAFARRVTAYEFAKYEQAAMRIEIDTLGPFGRAVRVAYAPGAVAAAIAAGAERAQPQSQEEEEEHSTVLSRVGANVG